MTPNFKKTTDKGTSVSISGTKESTSIVINRWIHPNDRDKLHEILDSFLLKNCAKTNKFLTDLEYDFKEREQNKII